ncbi:MAG: amidohydrolase [Anaerococcus vaginalis]|uniref:amidohydrolase n=1 Tax=Anaerococcus vaginalis TaxID=33037 RepID=UPI002911537C|nr:amidohydrolase [Anaerococcus vaginalis]MDU4447392.1 amidohydrolase [Anaerococcus vaginalis]MDU6182206.1 amidohydrolase [Anaerococcus vaginalis]MDU7433035.1 amidohydrolase [Anaerococcus vaginalis]
MIEEELIRLRRHFHKYAEPAWMEFLTTAKIIQELKNYNLDLYYGKEIYFNKRMGLPEKSILESYKNSISISDIEKKEEILDSYTGLIAVLDTKKIGPNIGFRFDIDSNELCESNSLGHLPNILNFSSKNSFAMHACGHDAHMSIGIELAKILASNIKKLKGKIIFIFQPAEEGVRGAYSLMNNPIIDKLDYLAGMHIGMDVKSGEIGVGSHGFLATKKIDIIFKGKASHAGASPEKGHNALLAASSAVLNFNSLAQHSMGEARINVGKLNAGSGRNIIANKAKIEMEIRGENENIISYLYDGVNRIVEGSAISYDCSYEIEIKGQAPSLISYDEEFIKNLRNYYKEKSYKLVDANLKGSEDIAYLLNEVRKAGGKTVHFILGSNLKDSHHSEEFDINEKDMLRGVDLMVDFVKYIEKIDHIDYERVENENFAYRI